MVWYMFVFTDNQQPIKLSLALPMLTATVALAWHSRPPSMPRLISRYEGTDTKKPLINSL
jgi:hypothetical protein